MAKYRPEWGNIPHIIDETEYSKQLRNKREQWESWCMQAAGHDERSEPLSLGSFNIKRVIQYEDSWHGALIYQQAIENTIDNLVASFDLMGEQLTTLDLGSLSGKWTQLLSKYSKEVICVDVFDYGFGVIRERHKNIDCKLSFYLTSGDELKGIVDGSVDFVFSIDSINKDLPVGTYERYFKEFARVLSPRGFALVHLPPQDRKLFNLEKLCKVSCLALMKIDSLELTKGEVFCLKKRA